MPPGMISFAVGDTATKVPFVKTDQRGSLGNNIRITKEELDRMNRTSVQLADGSGDYAAALGMFSGLTH